MATAHEEWLERSEVYTLGALDGEELKEFEAHLASGCPICQAYLRETRETLMLLHRSLRPETPPLSIKTRVLERVAPSPAFAEEKSSWFNWNWWGFGIGAFATAIVALVLTLNLNRTRGELEKVKEQLAAVQSASAQKDEQLRLLSSPDVRLVELRGLEAAPAARGKFFWNPTLGLGLLVANGLPQTPPDKAYELWGIAGNEPVAAGVFSVDEKGQARFNMPAVAKQKVFDKFAVTVEPASGVIQPTGPMVLLGTL